MRRTKIVATIGPASESPEMLRRLVHAGMDVARLNLSHGGRDALEARLRRVLAVRAESPHRPLGILVDTRGPEIRIDAFRDGGVTLVAGQTFTLYPGPRPGDAQGVGVSYARLHADVAAGQSVLLDDGNLTLRVEAVVGDAVRCTVECGGVLVSGKKVNLPGVALALPPLHEEDALDLCLAVELGADFVAASFINTADDVLAVRRVLEGIGGAHLAVIAKIETQQGVQHADEILRASDGLMVARGDLGVELPAEEVPLVQKDLIVKCVEAGKPVITATQMLESMVVKSRPTRAEASDVANAIFDGSDAVMLSAETAVGQYPLEAVRTMARIAERTEQALPFRERLARRAATATTVTDAISYATALAAQTLGAAAIVTVTETGLTARMVAKYRPRNLILAATAELGVCHQLSVVWGVQPLMVVRQDSIEDTMAAAVRGALEGQAIHDGDLIVITAGTPAGLHGTTNMLQVQTVGEVALRGTGIGRGAATGRVLIARGDADAERLGAGDVLVVSSSSQDWTAWMQRAGAIISEEGGQSSHAASVGLATGIPVIVGATDATRILRDGEVVTIDGVRGLCYRGHARVL